MPAINEPKITLSLKARTNFLLRKRFLLSMLENPKMNEQTQLYIKTKLLNFETTYDWVSDLCSSLPHLC